MTTTNPKLTTSALLPMPVSRQKAAAAWLTGFLREAEFDYTRVKPGASLVQFKSDMTSDAYRDHIKHSKKDENTWGYMSRSLDGPDRKFERIDGLKGFSMSAERAYYIGNEPVGVVLRVKYGTVITTFAGMPAQMVGTPTVSGTPGSPTTTMGHVPETYSGTALNDVYVGVVPGPSDAQPWQISYWQWNTWFKWVPDKN